MLESILGKRVYSLGEISCTDQWQIACYTVCAIRSVCACIYTDTNTDSYIRRKQIGYYHDKIISYYHLPQMVPVWSQIFIASLHTYVHVSSPLPVNSDILCDNNISGCIAFGSSYHSNIIFNPELWDS